MKKLILPLALLASIATLTSCTQKAETPTEVTPVPTVVETPSEVVPTATGTMEVSTGETNQIDTTVAPVSRNETVTYATPAGNDAVEFSVTITDGVITQASATPKANNDISKKMQTGFSADVSSKVVGKKVSDLDTMSAIGGASLTTGAFKRFVQAM